MQYGEDIRWDSGIPKCFKLRGFQGCCDFSFSSSAAVPLPPPSSLRSGPPVLVRVMSAGANVLIPVSACCTRSVEASKLLVQHKATQHKATDCVQISHARVMIPCLDSKLGCNIRFWGRY